MTLRVVGAGLGRTGTTSLKEALGLLLGGPCYHMLEVQERPGDPDAWGDAYDGRPPEWRTFFDGYRATVDWPAAPFWSEVSSAFPDALILLSVRDPDAWWKSASNTIFPAMANAYFVPDARMSTAITNSPQAAIRIPQGWTPQFPRDGHEKSPRTAMVSPHGRPRELPTGSLTANR